jgi:hypothetical protein
VTAGGAIDLDEVAPPEILDPHLVKGEHPRLSVFSVRSEPSRRVLSSTVQTTMRIHPREQRQLNRRSPASAAYRSKYVDVMRRRQLSAGITISICCSALSPRTGQIPRQRHCNRGHFFSPPGSRSHWPLWGQMPQAFGAELQARQARNRTTSAPQQKRPLGYSVGIGLPHPAAKIRRSSGTISSPVATGR